MGEKRDPSVSFTVDAPGWLAVYREGQRITTRELASWALVEREPGTIAGRRELVGMVIDQGRRVPADRFGGTRCQFCGYAAPGSTPDDLGQLVTAEEGEVRSASSWFG